MKNKLQTCRKAAKLTQEAIAKQCGITTRVYQYYESGGRVPNVYAALKIADALDSSVEELFSTND